MRIERRADVDLPGRHHDDRAGDDQPCNDQPRDDRTSNEQLDVRTGDDDIVTAAS